MLVLAAAIVSLWRCWPYKWHESPNGQCPYLDPEGCSSDGGEGSGHRQHDEHTPLLIDNDPRSRPSRVRAPTGSTALRPEPIEAAMESHRHRAEHAWMGSSPAGASFEEQYGSWCQRSGNMVQGATPNAG
ncbi:hypothetical protein GQ54DRAFT_298370 [Martensiomyces pterosporus]|nr:hypothetical protein GQ54DRAFT_298370 [Martensiomyces pterosporus]